jgi:hypothetical protein
MIVPHTFAAKPFMRSSRTAPNPLLLTWALAACLAGCSAPSAPAFATAASPAGPAPGWLAVAEAPPKPAAATGLDALRAAAEREIGSAACQTDSDCRTIEWGAKACGGPEAYRAWSATASVESRLREQVQAYNRARRAELNRRGMASDCSVVLNPGTHCALSAPGGPRCEMNAQGSGRAVY